MEILKTEHFAQDTKLGVLEITNDAVGVFEDLVKISTPYSTFKGVIIRSIIILLFIISINYSTKRKVS